MVAGALRAGGATNTFAFRSVSPDNMSYYSQRMESSGFGSARITWAVQRLILANIIVFALQLLTDPVLVFLGFRTAYPGGGLSLWLGFHQPNFFNGMVWTPFTYQFMHNGLMHLFMNMLWLFFFGPDVERVLGTRAFFRFYLFCGVGGVLATVLPYVMWGDVTNVVGASGAVMGVLVAFAMIEPDRQFYLFPFPWPINARALVLIVVVMNVIYALGDSPVSVMTHFGGMLMGFLYMKALPLLNSYKREKRRKEAKGKKAGRADDKVGEAVDNIFKFDDRKRR